MNARLTIPCAYDCGAALRIPRADADKHPTTWTCPACEQAARDQWLDTHESMHRSRSITPSQETPHERH